MQDSEAPKETLDPIKIFNKGFEALNNNNLGVAEEIFNALLDDDKKSDVLVFYLASTHMKKGNHTLAAILFQEVIRRNPEFYAALNNLGYVYKLEQMNDEARVEFEKAAKIVKRPELKINNQEKSEYIGNIGSTYIANGTPQKAIDSLNEAIAIDNNNYQAYWNRSLAYLELGNYEAGFADYDKGDRTERTKNRDYHVKNLPEWDGTKGKTIIVYGEQGIGDEIMFASVLPEVIKDCKVILDAHPRLMDLFRLSFPEIPVYGTRKQEIKNIGWPRFHGNIDARIQMGSLCKYYRRKKEDFPGTPYLKADPVLVDLYREKLSAIGKRKKVGISWRGGTLKTNKHTRKIKMDLLLPLLKSDVDFISLQYDKGIEKKIKDFEDKHGLNLNHWSDTLADYDHTAALVNNLDLIISVPQSVVHLAGALGTPTIQLCPVKALWQMGPYGEDMPWYNSVKNIWQTKDGDWETVISKAKEKLCSL